MPTSPSLVVAQNRPSQATMIESEVGLRGPHFSHQNTHGCIQSEITESHFHPEKLMVPSQPAARGTHYPLCHNKGGRFCYSGELRVCSSTQVYSRCLHICKRRGQDAISTENGTGHVSRVPIIPFVAVDFCNACHVSGAFGCICGVSLDPPLRCRPYLASWENALTDNW